MRDPAHEASRQPSAKHETVSILFSTRVKKRTHHEPNLLPTEEEPKPDRRAKRPEAVDHHLVDLHAVRRLRHAPLKDLVDDDGRVAAALEEALGESVLKPRVSREASDLLDGGAAEDEAGAGVAGGRAGSAEGKTGEEGRRSSLGGFGGFHEGRGGLAKLRREVHEAVAGFDEGDLGVREDGGERRAEEVALGDDLHPKAHQRHPKPKAKKEERTSASKTATNSPGPLMPKVLASFMPKLMLFALVWKMSPTRELRMRRW